MAFKIPRLASILEYKHKPRGGKRSKARCQICYTPLKRLTNCYYAPCWMCELLRKKEIELAGVRAGFPQIDYIDG